MFQSASDLIENVSGIQFTPATRLGDMLTPSEFETVLKVAEGSLVTLNTDDFDFGCTEKILNLASFHVKMLTKNAPPSNAVILMILFVLKKMLPIEDRAKYKSIDNFLRAYPDFSERDAKEKAVLCENANWMNILFLIIPAKVGHIIFNCHNS